MRAATARPFNAEDGLVEAGVVVYLPRLVRWRRPDEKKRVERPLFGDYLFAGLKAAQSLYDLEAVDGVHAVVRRGPDRQPQPVLFSDIVKVMARELAGEFDITRKIRKVPDQGDPVEITGGAFQGWPAKFVGLREDDRIEVLFGMFGRWTALVLPAADVRAL